MLRTNDLTFAESSIVGTLLTRNASVSLSALS